MITDVPGVLVGHWTDREAKTGCTVVVLPPGTVASGEVRGGAPASREFALLDPTRTVGNVDAIVLSGGSAFGLAAADGVMAGLAARNRGFETKAGPVPIVVGLSLFDLAVGDGAVRPGPAEGRVAFDAAGSGPHRVGQVGAGTGATVGKWWGRQDPGGLGTATIRSGDLVVAALFAVNAFGAIDDGSSVEDIGPPVRPDGGDEGDDGDGDDGDGDGGGSGSAANTTIGVVVTNATIDKVGCLGLAQAAHDGLARSLLPAHTGADGDAVVAGATGQVEADPMHLRALVQAVVASAVRSVGAD